MAENKVGIRNIMELLDAAEEVVTKTLEAGSDGYDASDALAIALDQGVREKLTAAIEDIKTALDELEDLDLEEADELTERARQLLFNILRAIKENL